MALYSGPKIVTGAAPTVGLSFFGHAVYGTAGVLVMLLIVGAVMAAMQLLPRIAIEPVHSGHRSADGKARYRLRFTVNGATRQQRRLRRQQQR